MRGYVDCIITVIAFTCVYCAHKNPSSSFLGDFLERFQRSGLKCDEHSKLYLDSSPSH